MRSLIESYNCAAMIIRLQNHTLSSLQYRLCILYHLEDPVETWEDEVRYEDPQGEEVVVGAVYTPTPETRGTSVITPTECCDVSTCSFWQRFLQGDNLRVSHVFFY